MRKRGAQEPPPDGEPGRDRPAPPPSGGEPEPGLIPGILHRATHRCPAGFPVVLASACQFGTVWAGLRSNSFIQFLVLFLMAARLFVS